MRDEYKKPYEYEEEKRGLIVLFISMILSIDTLSVIFFVAQINIYLDIPILRVLLFVMAGVFVLYIIYTSFKVHRMKSKFVLVAKRYIIIRTILFLISHFLIFLNRIRNEDLIGKGTNQYLTKGAMLYMELFIPMFFVLAFSVIWYLYFTFSKRSRAKSNSLP
jgi:hypothetical protein